MSSGTPSLRAPSRDGEAESQGDDLPALPLDVLPDFVDSSPTTAATAEPQRQESRATSLPFMSDLYPEDNADTASMTRKHQHRRHTKTTSSSPHTVTANNADKQSLDRIQGLLQECTRAFETLAGGGGNRGPGAGSARRSTIKLMPGSRTGSLTSSPGSPTTKSLRRARESVVELIGTSASTLALFDIVPPVRHHRRSDAPTVDPAKANERKARVQFQDGAAAVEGQVSGAVRVPTPPLEWSMGASNPLGASQSVNRSGSTPSSRENRRDLDGSRRGLLASSTSATVLDVAYILASLAICIAAVTYLALYRASPGNDDAQVSTPICIAAIVVGQAVSMAWCGSRFVVQTRKGEWEIVDRVADIAQLYRRTWLAFDLFCVVPFEWVCLGWATDYAFWLSLRQLVRFGRFLSLIRSGNPLRDTRNTVRMLAFVAFVTFTIHCLAVIFQQIQNESNGPSEQLNYVGALYWAAMTLTSVGYGDVLPVADDWHRIYACVVMFSGVAMIASVTAFATSVLTTTDALQDAIKERKLMLASMIEYYRIPWEVEVEITALLPTALNAENEHKFTQLVSHMPAFMVERIEGYTRAKALSTSIPLFVELPVSVVLELTAHLHQRFYQANECIIQIGDEGREMFFIVTGTAEVVVPLGTDEEVIVAVLRGGSFFGEVALVQDVQRTASVIAVTLCELLVLSKVNFTNLVTRHVELRDIFLKEVFARHNITNLVKHELSIARRDQQDDFTAVGDLQETADPRPDANPLALE